VRPCVVARLAAASAALAAGAALLPARATPARTAGSAASLAALQTGVLEQLNLIRRRHGLVPLTLSAQLTAAAEQHTAEMLADGYFAHESADGSPFWKRIARYYPHIGAGYWSVGENLIWSGDALEAKEALSLWMASPGHRENILAPQYRQIGISARFSTDAPGDYAGFAVTVVDTDFGVRR
jgi:uncharacterized protein YkwD